VSRPGEARRATRSQSLDTDRASATLWLTSMRVKGREEAGIRIGDYFFRLMRSPASAVLMETRDKLFYSPCP
jgi:hypothetical protein